jgi:hypothetical protein
MKAAASALVLLLAAFGGIVGSFFLACVADLLSEEVRGQLDRIPHLVLKLAVLRLPAVAREESEEEWEGELREVLRDTGALPVTRLIKGTCYALGLLRVAGRLGHEFIPSSQPVRLPRASLNWMDALNEVASGAGIGVPEYYVDESGPDYAKSFHASVRMSGCTYGEAVDRSSAEAQQGAAEAAWTSVTEKRQGCST